MIDHELRKVVRTGALLGAISLIGAYSLLSAYLRSSQYTCAAFEKSTLY